MTKFLLGLALLGSFAAPAFGQQPDTWITITANGIQRGGFIPRSAPYMQGAPAVSVYLIDPQDVRTADGLVVTGFEFIGWTESDATRVQVFLLVPRIGAPNTYLPGGGDQLLERRDFATYRILRDQGVAVTEMRELGIEPMILSASRVPPMVADIERVRQFRDALQQFRR